jgi:hypothetical protein
MFRRAPTLLVAVALCLLSPGASAATPVADTRNPGSATCAPEPGGLLLVAPAGGESRLDVIDPASGELAASMDLPPVQRFLPSSDPSKSYALTAEGLWVVDAGDASANQLDIPTNVASKLMPDGPLTRGTAGVRYQILGDATQTNVYLIDLTAATATDLLALLPKPESGPAVLTEAKVSADDRTAVLWDGNAIYLVDTAAPTAARRIGGEAFTYTPELSPDGASVAFGRRPPSGGTEIVVASIADDSERVVRADLDPLLPLWPPQRDVLLIDRRPERDPTGELFLLDLDSRETLPLLEYEGAVLSVQFSSDGRRALASVDQADLRDWHLLDLESGGATVIPEAGGQTAFPGLFRDSQWALMTPTMSVGGASTNRGYGMIDLDSGQYTVLLDQLDPAATYSLPVLARAGNAALVEESTQDATRLWFFVMDRPSSRPIAGAALAGAALSPDGCWTGAAVGDTVRLTPAGDGPVRELPGSIVAWVDRVS